MTYSIKTKGRPKATYKVRSIKGITPKGFKFHKLSHKTKSVTFKREDEL